MATSIFEYEDLLSWLTDWLAGHSNKGRGIPRRLSQHLGVSTVLISQMLKGDRTIKVDHAYGIADFAGLSQSETDHLIFLAQLANAETPRLRDYLGKKVKASRQASVELKNRVANDIRLTEVDKAKFYSHWMYSAVRLMTDFEEGLDAAGIAKRLNLLPAQVAEALEFLVSAGLCTQEKTRFRMAVQNTHLEADSPWILSRQLQWRNKAAQSMEKSSKQNMFYTAPMSISKKDAHWVRDRLGQAISEIGARARESKSEDLLCLNVDFFTLIDSASIDP